MAHRTVPRRTEEESVARRRELVEEMLEAIKKHCRRRSICIEREQMLLFVCVFIPKAVHDVLKEIGAETTPRECRDECARAGRAIDEIIYFGWTLDGCAEARAALAGLPIYLDAFLFGAGSKIGHALGVDVTRADILRWLGEPPSAESSRWLANLARALRSFGRLKVPRRGQSFEPSKFAAALVVYTFLERVLSGKVPSTKGGLFWLVTQNIYELIFRESPGSVARVCAVIVERRPRRRPLLPP
jgi:hypothetical protein